MINYKHLQEKTSLEDEIRSYKRIEMFLTLSFCDLYTGKHLDYYHCHSRYRFRFYSSHGRH
jgi:hypothetical protein